MKRIMLIFAFLIGLCAIAVLTSLVANAQTVPVNCNDQHGTIQLTGTGLTVTCPGGQVQPPTPPPAPTPGTCSASQTSDVIGNRVLARRCYGTVSFRTSPTSFPVKDDWNGDLVDLAAVLSGNGRAGNFMGMLSGAPILFTVDTGTFVSFSFTPNAAGLVQFTSNPSYGAAGVVSLSTRPGQFVPGNPAVICTNATGGGLYASSASGAQCPIALGRTYYINFAGVDYNGNQFCGGGTTGVCSSVLLAYTEYAKKF